MEKPIAAKDGWTGAPSRIAVRSSSVTLAAVCIAASLLVGPQGLRAAEPAAPPPADERMTDTEAASLGCAVSAAGAGLATVAAGGAALIVAEVGAASTAVAVPVLVATMAGACSLGSLATPAVRWLTRKGTALSSAVARTVAAE